MSIKEYLENLTRLKNLAVDRFGNLTTLEKEVIDSSYDWLVDNLDIKRGEVVVDEELSRMMNEFVKVVVDIVNNNQGFQSSIGQFLGDLKTIQDNNKKFHATAFGFDINKAGVNDVQKAVVGEIIEQYTGNGLNQHFAAPLKDSIYRNILLGANMKDIKQVLQNYILSGADQSGKLQHYLHNTAIQAADSYTGAINQKLAATFKFDGYIISGSLIETSSKQCIYAVETSEQGYLSFEDWEKVLDIARNNPKAKLIEGTTVKNLPLNKLHWGCRHDFTPVIKKKVEKQIEKPISKKEEEKIEQKVVPVPPKSSPYREAKTKTEAKEISKNILRENAGIKINKVSASSELELDLFNRMNRVLNDLTTEYKISPVVNLEHGTDLKFQSTSSKYGSVRSAYNGDYIASINFGHNSDTNRAKDYSQNPLSMPKSRVDWDNQPIATVVHEFGHVISVSSQASKLSNIHDNDFWLDIVKLQKEYSTEVRSFAETTADKQANPEELNKIFLGNYAYVNYNEFMAEAFTEYKLRKEPSKYAKKVGLLIDKYFKK